METENEAVRDRGEDPDGPPSSRPSPPPSSAENANSFDYVGVFENIGSKVYKYFLPEEIFRMSLASGRLHRHVAGHLIHVFKRNIALPFAIDLGARSQIQIDGMPLFWRGALEDDRRARMGHWLGIRPRTRATFASGNSFPTRDKFIDYVVQVVLGGSDLRVGGIDNNGTRDQTQQESSTLAREGLKAGSQMRLKLTNHIRDKFIDYLRAVHNEARDQSQEEALTFADARDQTQEEALAFAKEGLKAGCTVRLKLSDLAGSIRLQPSDRGRRIPIGETEGDARAGAGEGGTIDCHHARLGRRCAKRMVNYHFRGARAGYRSFARSWLHYILSQHDTLARHFRYVFVHPNEIESVVMEGLVISNATVGDSITVRFKTQV